MALEYNFFLLLTKIVNRVHLFVCKCQCVEEASSGNAALQFVTFSNEIYNEL